MVETFLVWIKKVYRSLAGFTFFQNTKRQSVEFYSYDNIPFKLYIEIAEGASVKKLLRAGKATTDQLALAWEQIIKKNSEHNGTYQYSAYFQLFQAYELLVNEYQKIKAMLTRLSIKDPRTKEDLEVIKEVRRKGYTISLSNSEAYAQSILNAQRKSENLVTKIRMKQNELKEMKGKTDSVEQTVGFEQLIANLSMGLGFAVGDDITLARFNEYQKLLKKKQPSGRDK